MAKQQKQVRVIARYTIKRNGYVCYLVRSSNGEDTYCTTFDAAGHATGCSCPAKKPCYHMVQLQEQEAERQAMETERWSMEAARTPRQVETPVEAPVSTQTVISKAEQAPTRGNIAFGAYSFSSGLAQVQQARNERRARERRESAALTSNKGFSLMR